MDVLVINGYPGRLVYVSRKTGYETIFENQGAEDFLTIDELRSIKNSSPTFFKNGWMLIEDPDVIYDLSLEKYYENILNIDELTTVFELPVDKMVAKISKLPEGQKKSLVYKALELIETKQIDSLKTIEALEKVLNAQLIERV